MRVSRPVRAALWVCLVPVVLFGAIVLGFAAQRLLSPASALTIRGNPDAPAPPAPDPARLRIVTYNICCGRGNDQNRWPIRDRAALEARLAGIAGFLKSQAPDLAVLNEVDFDSMFSGGINEAEYLAREAGFPWWVEQRSIDVHVPFLYRQRFGNVVLSRMPFRKAAVVHYAPFKRWEAVVAGSSGGVLCEFDYPPGASLRLLATHLEPRSETVRIASAQVIDDLRLSAPGPFIVAGDLNSSPVSFPGAQPADGQTALSLLLQSGAYTTQPLQNPAPEDFTAPVEHPSKVIDWVLAPGSWSVASRQVHALPCSDHCAVVVDVAPPARPDPPSAK